MSQIQKNTMLFAVIAAMIMWVGIAQSWNSAMLIISMGLISSIMALGVNLQWGFAGLFNVGIMGFVALGGLAAVLVGMPATPGAWSAGGFGVVAALILGAGTITATVIVRRHMQPGILRTASVLGLLVGGFLVFRSLLDPSVLAIEAINPAQTGYLGGLNPGTLENYKGYGLIMLLAWPLGGVLAAGAAWLIGKTALGLRSDYLAIATLGIAEIIIAILKNEDWLTRGVKNVIGIPRPVPYEISLQVNPDFVQRAENLGFTAVEASTLWVKFLYILLFAGVLLILLWMAQRALHSPWGRMLRAIRDNEVAAEAMGKDVTARHLQVFILGSAICGIAGAMMTTLDSQLTPGTYQPLRFTFLIWVMVIVGGSGNNFGAVLGGFLIWFLWVQVEPMGAYVATNLNDFAHWIGGDLLTTDETLGRGASALKFIASLFVQLTENINENVQHMRLLVMGLVLILVLRFSPRGLIPEK